MFIRWLFNSIETHKLHFVLKFAAFSNQTTLLLKALIADNVASDKQSIVFGNLGAFMALGFITAPVISGTILESQGGFHNLSLLMTVLTAISLGKCSAKEFLCIHDSKLMVR